MSLAKVKVAIRADASAAIGAGHVMRCLALAAALRTAGADVIFFSRMHPGHLCGKITEQGFRLRVLSDPVHPQASAAKEPDAPWQIDLAQTRAALEHEGDVDWLVVDHYELGCEWEQGIRRGVVKKLMAIDDLAGRKHDCDLLLDQNLSAYNENYRSLAPQGCTLLLGPSFALLRSGFTDAIDPAERDLNRLRILVGFGGSDPTGETLKAIEAIGDSAAPDGQVDVVAGANTPSFEKIRQACNEKTGYVFHGQVGNMAELIKSSSIAIGGGGVSALERCALGLPSLVIAVAGNQVAACEALATAGAIEYLGRSDHVSVADIRRSLSTLIQEPPRRANLAKNGRLLVDGAGANRVAIEIEKAANGL